MIIPIPLGRSWTVTLRQPIEADYQCASCRWESPVVVNAVTQGRGVSPLFLDDQGAQDWAYQKAAEAMKGVVRYHLDLLPCPKCGAAGPGKKEAARDEVVSSALFAGFLWLVTASLGGVIAAAKDSIPGLVVAGVASLAVAGLALYAAQKLAVWRRIGRAQRSVVFGARLKREESSYQPAPPAQTAPEPAAEPASLGPGIVRCPACSASAPSGAEFCPKCLGALQA